MVELVLYKVATTLEELMGRQEARERVTLKLIMKPLRVVRECVGLKGGRKAKGFGYETLEKKYTSAPGKEVVPPNYVFLTHSNILFHTVHTRLLPENSMTLLVDVPCTVVKS